MLRRHVTTTNTTTTEGAASPGRSPCKSPARFAFLKRGISRRTLDEPLVPIHRVSSRPCQVSSPSHAVDPTESTSELDILRSKSYESHVQPTMESTTQHDSSQQNHEDKVPLQPVPPPESVSLELCGGQSICSELSLDAAFKGEVEVAETEAALQSEELLEGREGEEAEAEEHCLSIPFARRSTFVPPEYVIIDHATCFPLEL